MKKWVLFTGVGIFLLGILAFFLSGSTSGSSPETATPTVPFLYGTNQLYWILLAFAGVVLVVVGGFLKSKKK
jgi:uncharacterized membrane protein HdeD (DUF308 family)